ncbi:MAG TPA: metal-sensing transcriptional repressor [Nitrospinota bacterium]|jgi:hypothetical protein NreA|nr:metal-sensing transcriptional repressor [Nitrospinota bacterium]|tara:strand:- start:134915 stop:135187 length:273 start_codon:yes stop_codon:yes gene_type:complete
MIHESHPEILKRLKRALGHLQKVINMMEEGSPCIEVAQQMHAVEKAVSSAKRTMIHDHIDHCVESSITDESDLKNRKHSIMECKNITKFL